MLVVLSLLLAVGFAVPSSTLAQNLTTRPHAPWRTVETENFTIHYPAEMERWTLDLASRVEAVREAVSTVVGSSPAKRVTVVVEDPYNLSNGYVLPFLDSPAMVLWPTPPEPSSQLGNYGGWGEILAIHEYAHLAHLTRPSRNPWQRLLWRLLPARLGPVALKAPRWLFEGYATYLEGQLTGSGRPFGASRPAILRQWALEGKLPRYTELNSADSFYGGAMSYLVGSAFIQWLIEREGRGDESLVHLWRRMSARRNRTFDDAFAGVFRGRPEDLYGRFTAELTGKALAIERQLHDAGIVDGETLQKLTWHTGPPALSRDGSLLAIQLRSRDRPSRVVVWRTAEEPGSERLERERERLLRLDPEDVPAVPYEPEPKEPLATLHPMAGRAHESPRFFADGKRILVSRVEPLGDGRFRPDLFIWNWETQQLRRVTRGASVRHADPSPDGRSAVGVRCRNGVCDLVRVDIGSGALSVLAEGSPTLTYYRPRYSRDGRNIVVAVKRGRVWRLALTTPAGAALRFVGPDDGASRYDATFLGGGEALVAVSEFGGVPNLEIIDLHTGRTRPLTRVAGAVLAPEPTLSGDSVYFLMLHGRGWDLNRVALDNAPDSAFALDPRLAPVSQLHRSEPPIAFTEGPFSPSRLYDATPRRYRVLPGGAVGAEGAYGTLFLSSTDPIGRFSWALQASYGGAASWRGVAAGAAWRAVRPTIHGDLFFAEQRPSRQRADVPASPELDVQYAGGIVAGSLTRDLGAHRYRYRLGASIGALDGPSFSRDVRRLAFAEFTSALAERRQEWDLTGTVQLRGTVGSTAGTNWRRIVGNIGLGIERDGSGIRLEMTYGSVNSGAGAFEQFAVGGGRVPLFDPAALSQRIAMPALPTGAIAGHSVLQYRVTLSLWGEGLDPFYWVARTDSDNEWHRVIGVERSFDLPTFPLARLPNVSVTAGVGYSLDEPFRHETRAYLSVVYRP